jgi:hypothetical protein
MTMGRAGAETSSSNWILNVQLITQDQDAALLDLLRFPDPPLLPPDARVQVSDGSRGQRRLKLRELTDFISSLVHQQANEVQLDFKFEPWEIPGSAIIVSGITNLLSISSTSSVWKPAGDEPADRAARRIWSTAVGMEQMVRWQKLDSYPTLLQSVIEIESQVSRPELMPRLFDIMADSIPQMLVHPGISGAADLEKQLGPANLLQAIAPWPGAIRFLNQRFDNLHPIMFGPVDRCKKLMRALGSQVLVREIGSELGIVHVPDELVKSESSQAAVKNLLVPKDDSTRFKLEPKEELGEFKLGTGIIFTYRRHLELTRLGLLSPPSRDRDYFHLIRPRYCELLGWDPDEMVVSFWNKEGIRRVDAEIDLVFAEMSHILPLERRVWEAHKEVNMRHGWARYVMDLVEKLYFTDSEIVM